MKNPRFAKLSLIVLIFAATGCANVMGGNTRKAGKESYDPKSIHSSAATSTEEQNYKCPSTANVKPDFDKNVDGSDRFTVCVSRTAENDLLVHGRTNHSNEICIIPVNGIDDQHVYPLADPLSRQMMKECVVVSDNGVHVSFPPQAKFNSVVIVEGTDYDQMVRCMYGSNGNFCPLYSFGSIR